MTRNTPKILPYCQHCGNFKGVGLCRNTHCDKTKRVDIESLQDMSSKCFVCSKEGIHSCSRCRDTYCEEHGVERNETHLVSIEQHLGTCVICDAIICEHCWIFNNSGSVTCLAHLEPKNNG